MINIPGYKLTNLKEGCLHQNFLEGIHEASKTPVLIQMQDVVGGILNIEEKHREFPFEQLSHPHLFPFMEQIIVSEQYFLIWKKINGKSLAELLQQYQSTAYDFDIVFIQMASALNFLKLKGLFHGGISSENIIIGEDGNVVLSPPLIFSNRIEIPEKDTTYWSENTNVFEFSGISSDIYNLSLILVEMLQARQPILSGKKNALISDGRIPTLKYEFTAFQPLINQLLAHDRKYRCNNPLTLIDLFYEYEGKYEQLKAEEFKRRNKIITLISSFKARKNRNQNEFVTASSSQFNNFKRNSLTNVALKYSSTWKFATIFITVVVSVGILFNSSKTETDDFSTFTVSSSNNFKQSAIISSPSVLINTKIEIDKPDKPKSTETPAKNLQSNDVKNRTDKENVELISTMLKQVKHYVSTQNFTTPQGKNAYELLKAILVLDPNNVEATKGIQDIVDGYYYLAKLRLKKNQFARAKLYIKKGLEISKNDTGLHHLNKFIEKTIQNNTEKTLASKNIALDKIAIVE